MMAQHSDNLLITSRYPVVIIKLKMIEYSYLPLNQQIIYLCSFERHRTEADITLSSYSASLYHSFCSCRRQDAWPAGTEWHSPSVKSHGYLHSFNQHVCNINAMPALTSLFSRDQRYQIQTGWYHLQKCDWENLEKLSNRISLACWLNL